MGNLKGVVITKGTTGPNVAGLVTSPSAILSNAPVTGTSLLVNTVYKITSVKQAEDLGITAARDITNDVVLHRHIVDFFSMAGEGVSLRIMLTDASSPSVALDDTTGIYARKLIAEGRGEIKQLGITWNVAASSTAETLTDGFNGLIRAAIPKAQDFAVWCFSTDRPCHVVLEGRRVSDTLSAAIDLRAITVGSAILAATKVSLIIGQDYDYAEARRIATGVPVNSKVHYYAAVGKALGTIAAAEMNQSIAEVAVFNLSNAAKGYFLTGGLSSHKKLADVDGYLQDLEDKGYIFPMDYTGVSGLRWNNDHVCAPIIVDELGVYNEHMIYYGRTLDESAMQVKTQLLNQLKSRVTVDPSTGKLATAVIKYLEATGNQVFTRMASQGFIVQGKTFINVNSDLVTNKKLQVSFSIVAFAILQEIDGTINLTKSIQL